MSQNARDDSRQRYVYGKEALLKMQDAKILIVGTNGVASEIAKNLVLTGTAIGIAGQGNVKISDLSANALIRETDIGKPLVEVIAAAAKSLNPSKKVQIEQISQSGEISNLKTYTCVVQTDTTLISPIKLNQICKSLNIPYQLSEAYGLSGRIFNDFGNKFIVTDTDGERVDDIPASEVLLSITNDGPQLYIGTKEVIPYADGSLINIMDVHFQAKIGDKVDESLSEKLCMLFNNKNYRVTEVTASRCRIAFDSDAHKEFIQICNSLHKQSGDVAYIRGGYLKQVKESLELNFKSLGECYEQNCYKNCEEMCDWVKFGREQLYNAIFAFLDQTERDYVEKLFKGKKGSEALDAFITDLKNHHSNSKDTQQLIDEQKDVLKYFLGTFRGDFPAVVSIIGGWGAQEALKAVSGKFTPINQFYYYDCYEILQEQPSTTPDPQTPSGLQPQLPYGLPEDMEPQNSRYDGIIQSVGLTLLQRMQNQKIFIVGAGALGCELLKLAALIGIKDVTVTDMDGIEPSNLSRQFLFRDSDRGRLKSEVAAERTKQINPEITVTAMAQKMGPDNPLPDSFWSSFTIIINALDNVETRRFMDQQCLLFNKPLLESGTMGQKASTQVVVPRLTQNYAAQADPSSHDAPACTIHNFPSTFTHCIVHSQSEFEGLFARCSEDLKMFIESQDDLIQSLDQDPGSSTTRLTILAQLDQALGGDDREQIPGYVPNQEQASTKIQTSLGERITLEDLQNSPEKRLEYVFRLGAMQYRRYLEALPARLLATNPVDSLTSDGAPFWQGDKRPPKCLSLDLNDENCRNFIKSFGRLFLRTLGVEKAEIEVEMDKEVQLKAAVQWALKAAVIGKEEVQAALDTAGGSSAIVMERCTKALRQVTAAFMPTVERFDKDEITGTHVDALSALANGRARCYGIPEKTADEVRRIAGRVVPAMVTATAAVVGLIGTEYAKIVAGRTAMETYKQAFLNMALPLMQLGENAAAGSAKTQNGTVITPWDFLEVTGNPTVQDIIDLGKKHYDVTIDGIMQGAKCVYMEIMDGDKKLGKTLRQILTDMGAPPIGTLVFAITDEDETELPYLKVSFEAI